ncbi:TetR/AcrR family transcriptional regulator [Actinotalea sp. BY-33]|uniref:TetR/AcrR family transcriptional regulator n=1 Tax=Actinotalea soli TaxID=2819234 RepID=A0A939RU40_9CELL|nr:TetR/AcrR family transcriptional regulator [Actinotalea soli]MBO1752169.1 TetR/AcrR family transcriptional regulator [Actinotalea soli]
MATASVTTPEGEGEVERGAKARTRRAILEAAATVLAADGSASLTAVADAAGVGRTTLHRYFPERVDLVRALAQHTVAETDRRYREARPDDGDPVAALRRIAEALLDLGPVLMYLYSEPLIAQDAACQAVLEGGEDPLDRLLDRAAPALRPDLPVAWVRRAFWSLLYTAWEAVREDEMARHEVLEALMATFTAGVLAPQRAAPGSR